MSSQPDKLRRFTTTALVVAILGGLGAMGYGVYLAVQQQLALGLAFLGGGLAGLLVGVLLVYQILLIQKLAGYAYRAYDTLLEACDFLRRQEEHSRTIAENSNLSDWAKRVAYREKDYEYLRDTIQGAIIRQDWESAEHLIRDMDRELGYHDEAAHLHEELEQARRATTEERIQAALARFESLCTQHKWNQALTECERLRALFPGQSSIAALPREIERCRQEVKLRLLKDYDQAVRNEDIDHAHSLLYTLDQYLVPQEVEALKESARGVFRARLEQLKTGFTIAVFYKQFPTAIEAGERLIREFPNSGYAQEISKLLPVLRQRAAQQGPHATATPPRSVS